MLWMQTYMFYCSVRLGVIVIAFLTLLQLLGPAVLLLIQGIKLLDSLVDIFQNDDHYNKNVLITKFFDWVDQHPQNVIVIINSALFLHICTCFLAFYGALKLSKYFLLPFISAEFIRVIICLAFHIILMIVLKKIINLGVLIAFTLLGGFLILYLAYNWCTCVALFQILSLIHSDRYRRLYGDDPFSPNLMTTQRNPSQISYSTIENVHVITTPNGNDIDELKRKNNSNWKINYKTQYNQPIISVLPVNNQLQYFPKITNDNRTQKQRLKKLLHKSKAENISQTQNIEYDSSVNYGNWQWSELLVKGVHKQNDLIGINTQPKY